MHISQLGVLLADAIPFLVKLIPESHKEQMIYREARGRQQRRESKGSELQGWGTGGGQEGPPPSSWSMTEDGERRKQPELA